MNTIDCLVDIARNMGAIDKDGMIKVFGDGDNTYAVAANGKVDHTSIIAAHLTECGSGDLASMVSYFKSYAAIPELKDRSIGLNRMRILTGFAKVYECGNQTLICEDGQLIEIHFDSGNGHEAWYRFTSGAMVNEMVKIPKFIGDVCDLKFFPDAKAINHFNKNAVTATDLGTTHFWPMMNSRGYLFFSFDRDAPTNQTDRFEMARGLPYIDLPPHSYNASNVKRVLALAGNAKSLSIGISKQGFLQIDVVSGFGDYRFILFGSDNNIWRWNLAGKWPDVWDVESKIREDQCMHGDWEPEL